MAPDADNLTAQPTVFRSIGEIAKRLGVHSNTARNYAEQGHFPNARQLPSGVWQIPDSDVDRFLQDCRDRARFPRVAPTTTKADTIVTA